MLYNTVVSEILANDKVCGVKVKTANKITNIKADGVFIAIGRDPDNALIDESLQLTNYGYIVTDDKMHTSIEGVFAAGDIRDKHLRQIITACADGAIAGTEASIFVNNKRG